MAQQLSITEFFPSRRSGSMATQGKRSPAPPAALATSDRKRIAVRPVKDLCKTPIKLGRASSPPFAAPCAVDTVSLLSSDDDDFAPKQRFAIPPKCVRSNKTNDTSPGPRTPVKKHSASEAPIVSSGGSPGTRTLGKKFHKGEEISPGRKFFSPTKKRSLKKRSPISPYVQGTYAHTVTPRRLFERPDDAYAKACASLEKDDKTKFLLYIVYNYVKDNSLSYLLGPEACTMLENYMKMGGPSIRLVCRLYWRKHRWYKREDLLNIASVVKDVENTDSNVMFKDLVEKHFLVEGTAENMSFEDYTGILKVDDLKKICKFFKIRSQSKKDSIELLQSYCKTASIQNYFGKRSPASHESSNTIRVLNMLKETAGVCYKLQEKWRDILYRLHLMSYLGIDYDIIRTKQLELHLLNVKTKKEAFPIDACLEMDKPSIVFPTRDSFENYMMAHLIYENFLESTDSCKKISIIRHAFNLYNDLQKGNSIDEYRALPVWLRRFTPAYLYIKIMEEGFPELKKGKDQVLCRLALDMLSALLAQDVFRQHRRAAWYDEASLVLHAYLHQPGEAAKILVEAFASDLSEEAKDNLRPRAKKMANQKNIILDEKIRALLATHGAKECILEQSLPYVHFYKQSMENISKGKVQFESRSKEGLTVQSVESVAIECYLELDEYTNGQHWEGRIVQTIYFLLFWDIIYSKPKSAAGIYLCPYQRYPLDLFYDSFYESRKPQILDRLRLIEHAPIETVLGLMRSTWVDRPDGEQGGVSWELTCEAVCEVGHCLGSAAIAALCRRLAADYRHAHSGFPDLTLWDSSTNKVKFVEVKSDSDKPSMKQIQWMQYLLAHGIDTEFCYVGTKGLHSAVRNRKP